MVKNAWISYSRNIYRYIPNPRLRSRHLTEYHKLIRVANQNSKKAKNKSLLLQSKTKAFSLLMNKHEGKYVWNYTYK